jgi:hypothetical protein
VSAATAVARSSPSIRKPTRRPPTTCTSATAATAVTAATGPGALGPADRPAQPRSPPEPARTASGLGTARPTPRRRTGSRRTGPRRTASRPRVSRWTPSARTVNSSPTMRRSTDRRRRFRPLVNPPSRPARAAAAVGGAGPRERQHPRQHPRQLRHQQPLPHLRQSHQSPRTALPDPLVSAPGDTDVPSVLSQRHQCSIGAAGLGARRCQAFMDGLAVW